jgi:hypothetical protein
VIDSQRDVIDHRKRSEALGQATQINRRQSHSSLLFYAHSDRKAGIHFCGMRARAVVGLLFIVRSI